MDRFALGAAALMLAIGTVGLAMAEIPAAGNVFPEFPGCQPARIQALGSFTHDMRSDRDRTRAQGMVEQAMRLQATGQEAACRQALDQLVVFLRHTQTLGF